MADMNASTDCYTGCAPGSAWVSTQTGLPSTEPVDGRLSRDLPSGSRSLPWGVHICVSCQRPAVTSAHVAAARRVLTDVVYYTGRGLCQTCRRRATRAGTLLNFERDLRDAEEVLEDWVLLRDDGYRVRDAASRLGMTFAALDKAVARAKRRGDPRGSRVPFAHDMRGAA